MCIYELIDMVNNSTMPKIKWCASQILEMKNDVSLLECMTIYCR